MVAIVCLLFLKATSYSSLHYLAIRNAAWAKIMETMEERFRRDRLPRPSIVALENNRYGNQTYFIVEAKKSVDEGGTLGC